MERFEPIQLDPIGDLLLADCSIRICGNELAGVAPRLPTRDEIRQELAKVRRSFGIRRQWERKLNRVRTPAATRIRRNTLPEVSGFARFPDEACRAPIRRCHPRVPAIAVGHEHADRETFDRRLRVHPVRRHAFERTNDWVDSR